MNDISLVYAPPPDDLATSISVFFQFDSDLADFIDNSFRADIAQFMFVLRGQDGWVRYGDEPAQAMTDAFVIGPSTMNGAIGGRGPIRAFGMGITPAGWARLVPQAAAPLGNQLADAIALLGDSVREDHGALRDAADFSARVALAETMMRRLLTNEAPELDAFIGTVNAWLISSLSPPLSALERRTGLSRSQLARRCNQLYGSPPKALVRKYRALRAAARIANGHQTPLDFLAEGFSDQAHLIREIKHFTGLTPVEFRDRPTELLRLTIARTRFPGLSELIT